MTNLPLDLGYLTPEFTAKAERELGETEEVKEKTVGELRRLLKGETKLFCSQDDNYLLQFLRPAKYDVKRAFSMILKYYHYKRSRSDVYTLDFEGLQHSIFKKIFCLMPKRDQDGAAILVTKLENWDYNERTFSSILHDLTVVILFLTEDPATQVCGINFIFDLNTLSMNHLKHMHPKNLRLIAIGTKNSLPMRIKAIHVINESSIFQHIWVVIKLLLSEKVKSRVHFHSSNTEKLRKHISEELLPVEYGGKVSYDPSEILKQEHNLKRIYHEKMSYGYKDS